MPQLLRCSEEEIRLGRDLLQGKRFLQERQSGFLLEFVDNPEQFDHPSKLRLLRERLVELASSQHARTRAGRCSSCCPGFHQLSRSALSLIDALT